MKCSNKKVAIISSLLILIISTILITTLSILLTKQTNQKLLVYVTSDVSLYTKPLLRKRQIGININNTKFNLQTICQSSNMTQCNKTLLETNLQLYFSTIINDEIATKSVPQIQNIQHAK
jgi:hypothetical protein